MGIPTAKDPNRQRKSELLRAGRRPASDPVVKSENVADPTAIPARRAPTAKIANRAARYSTDSDAALTGIAKTGSVAVDLETKGLHPHQTADAAIGAVILRTDEKNYILRELPDWWPEVLADADTRVTATNSQFDLTWMISYFMEKGIPLTFIRNIRDPMIGSQLANKYRTKTGAAKAGNPGAWEPNDLAYMLKKYEGITISKSIDHDVTDWTGPWSNDMVDYMLEDIAYLDPLGDSIDAEIQEQGMELAAWIEYQTVPATAWMRYNGITPDTETWRQRQIGWREEAYHLHKQHLRKMWPTVKNFNSPKQILEASLSVLGARLPNTRKSTMEQLAPFYHQVDVLMDYRKLQTYNKNWGPGTPDKPTKKGIKKGKPGFLEKYVCGICSRFHPDWRQIGTETARYSCSSPNLQQIPRAQEFRSMFVAADGCTLASLDYSAIEVLAAAVFAQDDNLLAACATGDPHSAVAEMIYNAGSGHAVPWDNLSKEEKKNFRQMAKIVNFGLLFGGGAAGLVIQARDLFKTIITEEQARALIATYYQLFPGLKWTKNLAYRAMDSHQAVLEVRNAVGFRRFLERMNRKPTSWLNTWIQSSAGYGLKSSMPYLMDAGLLPFLCMQVHDELVFEFPDEVVEEYVPIAKDCLIAGMRDVLGQSLHINVDDTAVGKVWL